MAEAAARTLTSVCNQLIVLRPESNARREQTSAASTARVRRQDLDTIRRQLQELAERRLLVQLSASEDARYHELCAVERAGLARRDTTRGKA
jgi:hypothetical protein